MHFRAETPEVFTPEDFQRPFTEDFQMSFRRLPEDLYVSQKTLKKDLYIFQRSFRRPTEDLY
jgi:hypothetical protein